MLYLHGLMDGFNNRRIPLAAAVNVAYSLCQQVAAAHRAGHSLTGLDSKHITVKRDGHVVCMATPREKNGRADAMALGGVMYELFTGVRPSLTEEVPPPSQVAPGVDPELESAILSALNGEVDNPNALLMMLDGLFEELDIEPSLDDVARCVEVHRAPMALMNEVTPLPLVKVIQEAAEQHHAAAAAVVAEIERAPAMLVDEAPAERMVHHAIPLTELPVRKHVEEPVHVPQVQAAVQHAPVAHAQVAHAPAAVTQAHKRAAPEVRAAVAAPTTHRPKARRGFVQMDIEEVPSIVTRLPEYEPATSRVWAVAVAAFAFVGIWWAI